MSFDVFLISVLVSPAMFKSSLGLSRWNLLVFGIHTYRPLQRSGSMLSHVSYTPETSCLPGCFHKLQYEDDLK